MNFYTIYFNDYDEEIDLSSSNPIHIGEYLLYDDKYLKIVGISHKVETKFNNRVVHKTYLHVEERK